MTNGPFTSRAQLRSVLGFGEAAFVQAAGFLKITGGDNPLDVTWIHPESYAAAGQLLESLGFQPAAVIDKEKDAELAERLAGANVAEMAKNLHVGALTLTDIVGQLSRPGRDPRESLPKPIFKKGILKLDDLAPGMELMGTVLNVVDFGAFVDIGLKDTGLVHVSQLASKFIQDPHDCVSVGDIVTVWVMAVDKERRRVSLTLIDPATAPHGRRAASASHRTVPARASCWRAGRRRYAATCAATIWKSSRRQPIRRRSIGRAAIGSARSRFRSATEAARASASQAEAASGRPVDQRDGRRTRATADVR